MIQTGSVNDVKTGIGIGEAQVTEGYKSPTPDNRLAEGILQNRKLKADKAEKKAKERQKLYDGLNMDLKGTRTQDVPQIRALMADTRLKMQQDAAEGKLNMNSPEYQQRIDAIADGINASIKAEKTAQDYDKEGSKDGFLSGKYEFTPQSKKDHEALRSDNATPVGAENYGKWLEEVTGKTSALQASGVPQMVFPEMDFQKALASNATAYKNNHTNKLEIKDPNDPSQTIIIEKESYNPEREIVGLFDAPTPKGLAMQRYYTGMLSNNDALAKQYKFNPAPETKEQEVKNLEAAKQLAVDRNMQIGSVDVNKKERQGGGEEEDNAGGGNGVYKSNGIAYSTNNLQDKQSDKPMGQRQLDKLDALVALASSKDSPQSEQQNLGQYLQNNTNFTSVLAVKSKGGEGKELSPIDFTDISGKQRNARFTGYSSGLAQFSEKVNLGNGVTAEKLYVAPYDKVKGKVMAQLGNDIAKINEDQVKGVSPGGATMQTKTSNTNVQTGAQPKTISISKIKGLIGKPGYEGYTESELKDYYKSQGYQIK